jgi:predicted RNase H-like nuclease (RuvC/YqgF family)
MEDIPDNHLLEEFILKEGVEDLALLRRIRRAWSQVHKKTPCKKNCIAKPLYTQWVRERVAVNQLPFEMVAKPSSPEPITVVPIEEAEELRAKVAELQKKNEEWESKYLQAEGEIKRLKREQKYKEEALQGSRKRVTESEEKIEKIGDDILSAKDNLTAKDEEIERIKHSYEEVKKMGEMPLEAQKMEAKISRASPKDKRG